MTEDNYAAHYNLGIDFAERNDPAAAIRHYAEALRIDPGDAEARRRLESTLAARAAEP